MMMMMKITILLLIIIMIIIIMNKHHNNNNNNNNHDDDDNSNNDYCHNYNDDNKVIIEIVTMIIVVIDHIISFNPFMLHDACNAHKILTILLISLQQKHFSENIWRTNVYQKPTNYSPSNMFHVNAWLQSYFQKYHRSKRQLCSRRSLSMNG